MSTKPILFNTEMVKAIMDGRKTQTRRLIKNLPLYEPYFEIVDGKPMMCDPDGEWHILEHFSHIRKDDILYVRETWCEGRIEYGEESDGRDVPYISQCTGDNTIIPKEWALRNDIGIDDVIWRPSIHMPKEAARIFLRVKSVHAERLQDITEEGAEQEGCSAGYWNVTCGPWGNDDCPDEWTAIEDFQRVWNNTIQTKDLSRFGWEANPWVLVIEFEKCENPEGWCLE